ncbi:recombination protein RecR [Acinetobacter baumannii]|uniref:recombination mediator RecR n=1 Tax=Acinetobacter baumannii TaxID=470 RepID=UPI000A6F3811|nr:toprim domain-containing protein [Acinetobacter baumannii]OKO35289.1 recombination protein RecR [Acinetobacter baumannii]
MALHLLMKNREGAFALAHALHEASSYIHECSVCHSLTEHEICDICASTERDDQLLCVVESPADVMAIEQSGSFRGKYHVLGGHLSPIRWNRARRNRYSLSNPTFKPRYDRRSHLATNATVEGQATAHYLVEATKHLPIHMTRIAQGVPQGGELEYVDSHTLSQAVHNRMRMK